MAGQRPESNTSRMGTRIPSPPETYTFLDPGIGPATVFREPGVESAD